jgi:hypothetical protein
MIDAEAIVRRLQDAALNGDIPAARTLLERALPVYRLTAAPVELPDLTAATDLTTKARVVLDAVADGRVPPDVGAQLTAAIGSVARLAEIDELTKRVTALEQPSGNERYRLSIDELREIAATGRVRKRKSGC